MPGRTHDAPDVARERLAALGLAPPLVEQDPGPVATAGSRRHARTDVEPPALTAAIADHLPSWLSSATSPTPSAMLWLVAVCALCIAVTGYTLLHARAAAPAADPLGATQATFAPLPSPTPASVVVDVGGRVRRPGLVTVPLGSRVADALRAAGGALRPRDLLTLNLAAKVADGQLLLVGVPGAGAAVGGDGPTGSQAGPVDLNSATAEQLDALPGIGPVLAQHILDWRSAHGGFRSVDQLRDVSGIGDSTFADLAPLVTV